MPASAAVKNEDIPALFWDEYPENREDNPDAAAIAALLADSTPEERAEHYKSQGNDALRMGTRLKNKYYLREAVTAYSQGLEAQGTDPELNSLLHSNRAHVHLVLGNDRSALQDSKAALQLDSSNVKAYYRGAKAALRLGEREQTILLCNAGLALQADARELQQLRQEAEQQQAQAADQERRRQEAAAAARTPAKELAAALTLHRRWRIGAPQLSIGSRKPYVDADRLVHWPVLLMYPESGQQEAVEDWCEADNVQEHLDAMFGADAPPQQWDEAGAYTRERLEVYYLSHAAKPLTLEQLTEVLHGGWPETMRQQAPQRYGSKAAQWVQVPEDQLLGEVLSKPDYVVPGVPVFFVVAAGSPYRERFLAQDLPLL